MESNVNKTESWYETSYQEGGFKAQRRYPNEELLRFMGRHFLGASIDQRKNIKILEIGCGSCANLWVIGREGFQAYGLDLSEKAILLGNEMLTSWNVLDAKLQVGSMTSMPYEDSYFDAVLDVFSANCLDTADFKICLTEVARVLKTGGLYFSYAPGKNSDAFKNHAPATLIDESTLNGIHRSDSPYTGNHYPFRFVTSDECKRLMDEAGLEVTYLETVLRSYYKQREHFEHVVLDAKKK